ncbi:hypothetical protein H8D73_02240, partial [bacterium]|nr:hypothetical protein [bacterium]
MDDKLRQRLSELGLEPHEGEVRHARARSSQGQAGAPRPGGGGIETPGSIEELGGVIRDDGILVIDRSVSDLTSRRDV